MKRECGLYWVKYHDKWTIAKLTETNWEIIGDDDPLWDTEIDEIGNMISRKNNTNKIFWFLFFPFIFISGLICGTTTTMILFFHIFV